MQNYHPGDKVCLFGFSRGAYTARALAGMLYKIGLLPRGNNQQVTFAYKLYTRTDKASISLSAGFKQTYCRPVDIEFLGVWDTVSSVGVVSTKTLPFTSSNSAIKRFRQALSLDERRVRFKPNLYHHDPPDLSGSTAAEVVEAKHSDPDGQTKLSNKSKPLSGYFRRKKTPYIVPQLVKTKEQTSQSQTDVLEVWFAGCHSDIGGGAVLNTTKQCLANIPLRWMIQQIIESQCGIQFDENALMELEIFISPSSSSSSIPSNGDNNDKISESNDLDSPVSQKSDTADAVKQLHDELVLEPPWWLLEILPMRTTYQDANCVWHTSYVFNLGRGREIYTQNPHFHITVKERIADSSLSYKPKAQWQGTQVYVE